MDEFVTQIERETLQRIDCGEAIAQAGLSGMSAMAEQVAPMVPELPAAPFTTLVPKPAEVVKSSFVVASRMLDASRRITEGFVDALVPITTALMPWMGGKAAKRADRKSAAAQNREAA